MAESIDSEHEVVPRASGGWRKHLVSWSPSGWPQMAISPTGTGTLALGCPGPFHALRVGIPNAGTFLFTINKIAVCSSDKWNDYVNPSGNGVWRSLTFAGKGIPSDVIIDDYLGPTEIVAWPAPKEALPGSGNSPCWTWTDWLPMQHTTPDPTTGMHVVMLRWLNSIAGQKFTYANGLFRQGWTGLDELNHGFHYAIGGYNNGSDYVTSPRRNDMDWGACQRNSLLNGTPLAIVQFMTEQAGIVGMVAGDSHQSGVGTIGSFNGFLAQFTTSLGEKYRNKVPFGFVNCAVGGIASREIFSRLATLIPVIRPSFAVLPGWTYNEVHPEMYDDAAASGVFLTRLMQAACLCRQNGAVPIFLTPFPRDPEAMTPRILHSWKGLRKAILQLRTDGTLVVDASVVLGLLQGGELTGTYLPGLSDDGLHPNDAGHALVAAELAQIVELMAGLGDAGETNPPTSQIAQNTVSSRRNSVGPHRAMRTLVFCTSYADTLAMWDERWGRWVKAISHSGLAFEKILIVDDGSPVLPVWKDVDVTSAGSDWDVNTTVEIRHFSDRRGCQVNGEPFPGWYRSFAHAVVYAIEKGFDKIIHVEADAFLISDRAIDFFNTCDHGWIGLWCETHQWPESTMQIINKDQFAACTAFFSQPYSTHLALPYKPPEKLIPFTLINKILIGDRYGERSETIPLDADYVSQVKWNKGPEYYWWMSEDGTRFPKRKFARDPGSSANRSTSHNSTGFTHAHNADKKVEQPVASIIAISMVKNEQDIVEPFVRHTAMFVDHHVILDNCSVDETRRILTSLMREIDGVVVTTSSEFGYTQSERMSKLLRSCQSAFFADYIIFLDADEFISCETRGEFERHLSHIPEGGYGRIPWRTFVLTPTGLESQYNDPPRSIPWRRKDEHERDNIALNLNGKYWHDLIISQGNHSVSSSGGRPIDSVKLGGIYLNHFPIRSVNQLVTKSVVGWMAYLGKDPQAAQSGAGYHWHSNFDTVIRGHPVDHNAICDLSIRYDHPIRNWDWSNDVVLDVPPDRYLRRYSTGSYAEPLTIVAKSWRASLEICSPTVVIARKDFAAGVDRQTRSDTVFDAEWHWENPFADLAPFRYLSEKYNPRSVLDIGCGIGAYLQLFKRLGAQSVFGIDGIPNSATMLDETEYREVDLTHPFALGRKFDIVMCLEVAEHLPYEAVDLLLQSLHCHAEGLIVFSAGEPGQPGHGHITNIPIAQWLRLWEAQDWFPSLDETLAMRALSTLSWFKRNIIVLRKGICIGGEAAICELARIGSLPFAWHHTNPGIRLEVLTEDTPMPPFGYQSKA